MKKMQTFSARDTKTNKATVIFAYELALYCAQGYEIWQDTPIEERIARANHLEDLINVALEDNANSMKIGE